ncbi:sulfotransferase family protein [Nitrosococcus wardiae]|uniref:Uncharacterized protein n=1 Tax=Nitrosococcus wardiae TaxID=1814290 RepID=A0A4P7C0Q8_9GAMM|nr:sulfotransferase [Nitrosococcus wardiae]QBQ54422.1 hypothetical protein E3U44_07800 [Nitrosococcus wardiae]
MLRDDEFLDFVYVGAPRAGSTWLAAALNEHPDIWIPNHKEIHFFNDRLVYPFEYKYPRGVAHLRSYFERAPENAILGELSPFYYYDPNAAYRIYKHFPNARIIAFVRNPVDMIYSLYLLLRERERREATFERELAKNPYLLDLGFFHRLLTPYFDWFPQDRIFVAVFEDFFKDESEGAKRLFRFLGVRADFEPKVVGLRVNAATEKPPGLKSHIRGRALRLLNTASFTIVKRALHTVRDNRLQGHVRKASEKIKEGSLARRGIATETRKELLARFEPDIARLESLLGCSLAAWREP